MVPLTRQPPQRRRPGAAAPPGPAVGAEVEARRAQRLRTAEVLRGGRTPLQVIEVCEHAGAVAGAALEDALRRQPPRRQPACREGCTWCCHKVVGTAAPEVLRIAAYLREALPAAEWEAVRTVAVSGEERRRALGPARFRATLPCPLLRDGLCAAYAVRPLTCRGYNSSDARRCEASVSGAGPVEVPVYGPQQRLYTFVLDGLRAGAEECGLAGDLLELTAALRVALDTPDAAERWLAGEDVFAAARMP
jgi:Fe-S-cluster containining protein